MAFPVTTSLVSYWKLDEASGTRNDSHGTNHLTDNNTVGSTTGIISSGAQFVLANSEYLSRASNATLQTGDIDWTFTAWVNLATKATTQMVIGKDNNSSGTREYFLTYFQGADRFFAGVFRATDSEVNVTANNFGSPSTGTWYFVALWHDAAADTFNISVNDGTPDSQATGGSLQAASSAEFQIGARQYPAAQGYMDGVIDEVSFWKRLLTAGEITDLYNGGAGVTYPSSAPASKNFLMM